MPWSPIPKLPAIIEDLKAKGFTHNVNFAALEISVMENTGLSRTESIKNTIQIMEKLGYLEKNGATWKIYQGRRGEFN